MYKSLSTEIKKYTLDSRLYQLHKEGIEQTDFGMNNTSQLIDGGFGLYSTANTKSNIDLVKTEYYRIALIQSGTATYTIGLENFQPTRNTIVFGFPNQLFSLQNPTDDFFAYYMLFSENFIADTLLLKMYKNQFPFLTYAGIQCFSLTEEESNEVEAIFMKINQEVKTRKVHLHQAIQLYIQLIFIIANRNYTTALLSKPSSGENELPLFTRFLKLVSEHFLSVRKVSEYAEMLFVSADHLNRIIKSNSDKTAHELIDEMVLREAKAYLIHSELSISEIGYTLGFSDPSHFHKFFKKRADSTPLHYRNKSE